MVPLTPQPDRGVWKFSVPVNVLTAMALTVLYIPRGARFLHLREQRDAIAMWFEVDPSAPTDPRRFQILTTGTPFFHGPGYVGTAIFGDGDLVLHLYEVPPDPST